MGRVVVVGSINMDLVIRSPRFPEPGETLMGSDFARFPGGKGANQAVAAARQGADTLMMGAVGADPFGDMLRDTLAAAGVGIGGVRVADAPTGVALITVAGGENTIVVAAGANHSLAADVESLAIGPGDIMLAQLETPLAVTRAAFERARALGATTLLNAAPADRGALNLLPLADLLVVNQTELGIMSGTPLPGRAEVGEVADRMRHLPASAQQRIVVTLGARGVVAFGAGDSFSAPGNDVAVVDTTGAGDCFVGVLAAGLAAGLDLPTALTRANAAAALSVGRAGAAPSMPTAAEVDAFLAGQGGR